MCILEEDNPVRVIWLLECTAIHVLLRTAHDKGKWLQQVTTTSI